MRVRDGCRTATKFSHMPVSCLSVWVTDLMSFKIFCIKFLIECRNVYLKKGSSFQIRFYSGVTSLIVGSETVLCRKESAI